MAEYKAVTIHDRMDGRKILYVEDILNRLRAEAMKHARVVWPENPEKWREIRQELRSFGSIERNEEVSIFRLVMTDRNEKVWARYQAVIIDGE